VTKREPAGAAPRTFAVVGGAGAMGRITVRDLYETCHPADEIVVADFDRARAEALVASLEALAGRGARPRLRAVGVDVKDRAAAAALRGAFALVNTAQYHLNLEVMELALAVGAHYLDLGGLFHVTRQQLLLDERFRAAGKAAILGMGAAPGITNLLARLGADRLETVREIHLRVGSIDRTRYRDVPALPVAYSLKTVLEEFSMEPAVFTKGEWTFAPPMSGARPHRFPPPVGVRRPMYTLHSEVATLPVSFREKGVREVSFQIAFDPEFLDRVRFLRDLGMASHEELDVGGVKVRPIDVVNKVAMAQPPARQVGRLDQHEVLRAVVKGTAAGRKETWVVDCHAPGMPAWGIGLDVDTGTPPAVAAQMLAAGEITARGVVNPELAVPCEPFFRRLAARRMTVKASRKAGWSFAV
jgi:saccharopine dehydrogenase-like NADP-dependent oxidoreductase